MDENPKEKEALQTRGIQTTQGIKSETHLVHLIHCGKVLVEPLQEICIQRIEVGNLHSLTSMSTVSSVGVPPLMEALNQGNGVWDNNQ